MSLARVLADLEPMTETIPWEEKTYQLREPSEGAMDKFVSTQAQSKGDRLDSLDSEIVLVTNCLYCLDDAGNVVMSKDGKRKQIVDIAVVKEMPSRLVKGMFSWLMDAALRHRDESLETLYLRRKELDKQIKEKEEDPQGNGQTG